jgi:hypothetical protein
MLTQYSLSLLENKVRHCHTFVWSALVVVKLVLIMHLKVII